MKGFFKRLLCRHTHGRPNTDDELLRLQAAQLLYAATHNETSARWHLATLLDVYDDAQQPHGQRAYVEGTWRSCIDEARSFLKGRPTPLEAELLTDARRAVDDNVRHSRDSLFALLGKWHPEATDEQVQTVVSQVLG
jgi:hypothetical protein